MVSSRWVGWSVVGGSAVGGFNKTHILVHNELVHSESFTKFDRSF